MTLDEFTKTLDPALGLVQSNFGMEEQRRIAERRAEQGLSQNNRVGGMQREPAILLPNQGGGMQQPIATDIQQQF
jgi:hypothetical protein